MGSLWCQLYACSAHWTECMSVTFACLCSIYRMWLLIEAQLDIQKLVVIIWYNFRTFIWLYCTLFAANIYNICHFLCLPLECKRIFSHNFMLDGFHEGLKINSKQSSIYRNKNTTSTKPPQSLNWTIAIGKGLWCPPSIYILDHQCNNAVEL